VFGVRGEMKVRVLTDFPERFKAGGSFLLLRPGASPQAVTLASARPHRALFLITLPGVSTPEAAHELMGAELHVDAATSPKLPQGTYFLHEIVGLQAETPNGERLGTVVDIWQHGGADIYIVAPEDGGPRWMIPAVSRYVKSIDVPSGTILVEV